MSSLISLDANDSPFQVELPAAPYPGLRPFERHEWPIFFGRESMTTVVIDRLMQQRFVVVHGNSGCGKSSLIRAGVQAQLEQEQARSGRVWLTAEMHPGNGPLRAMAKALAMGDPQRTHALRRLLNRGTEASQAMQSLLGLAADQRMCLLVDQFEELFAFAKDVDREEARLFTDVLVSLERNPPEGLYLVLTMRSEFLGHCSSYPGLAEVVNRTQYLLPQMSRPALERAILEPARLYGGEVSLSLADAMIADSAGGEDQLPLIQHGLMLLHHRRGLRDRSGVEAQAWRLDLEDFKDQGGLSSLLSDHAEKVMTRVLQENPELSSDVIASLFRALTDVNADGHAIRRRQTLSQLVRLTSADSVTVTRILDAFRADGVSFLKPYGTLAIAPDDLVDISHEALIRCWRQIADPDPVKGWLANEVADGQIWRALVVQAESFRRDPKNVLSPATTEERSRWLGKRNSHWAERYGGHWNEVNRLIEASQAAAETTKRQEQERLLAGERLSAERVKRRLTLVGLMVAAVLAGLAIWQTTRVQEALRIAELEQQKAEEQREKAEQAVRDLEIANTDLKNEIERRKAAQAEIAQVQISAAQARDSAAETLAKTLSRQTGSGKGSGSLPPLNGSSGQDPGAVNWVLSQLGHQSNPYDAALLAQSLTKLTGQLDETESKHLLKALTGHLLRTEDAAETLAIAQVLNEVLPLLPASYQHSLSPDGSTELMAKLLDQLPSSINDSGLATAQILGLRVIMPLLAPAVSDEPAIRILNTILQILPEDETKFGSQQAREAFFTLGAMTADSADAAVAQQLEPVARTLALIGDLPAPRLYIHIAEEQQRPAATRLQRQLEKLQVNGAPLVVPGIQLITSFKFRSDLRCFREEECSSDGLFIKRTLSGWLVQPKVSLSDLSATYSGSGNIRPRHYELWIGPGLMKLSPEG